MSEAYNQQNLLDEQVRVSAFIEDIGKAYQWADIVICRAGALTVSELAMEQNQQYLFLCHML